MTPREIELLTIARLEHEGHQLTPADQREIRRSIQSDIAHRTRFRSMMTSPAYQWKKPISTVNTSIENFRVDAIRS